MKKLFIFCLLGTIILHSQEEDDIIDKEKSAAAEKLVNNAAAYFIQPDITIGKACHEFAFNDKWRKGELTIFIFGIGGEAYLVDPHSKIWEDYYDETNKLSKSFIKNMRTVGEKGGWVVYPWNNDTQHAYVKVVQKQGKKFIIGTGFYPESAKHRAQQLVSQAIQYFNEHGAQDLFTQINNPFGSFVRGDIYLWVFDTDGNVLAHGQNNALVGQNELDWQDEDGKYRNRDMIEAIKKSPEGEIWLDYKDHGLQKKAFVKSVVDPKTKKVYLIGGGYYPTLDDETVKNFVIKAINYLKANGKKQAFVDFENQNGDFIHGSLRIFVYDPEGNMLADAENPAFVGKNLINSKDAEGKFITKRILEQASKSGAWISFLDRNAYKDVYVVKISIPDGDFIVGAGYWPASKQRSAKALVDKAIYYVQNHPVEEAFRMITSGDSDFLRGDLFVFVFGEEGLARAYGADKARIWQPASTAISIKDTQGRPVFETIKITAKSGGGWIEFPFHNAKRRIYVKEIQRKHEVTSDELAAQKEKPKLIVQKNLVFTQEKPELEVESYIVGAGYYI